MQMGPKVEKNHFAATVITDNSRCLDTDKLHKNLIRLFKEDMQEMCGEDFLREAPCEDLHDIRKLSMDMHQHAAPYRFKARYQYCTYFKRYICQNESITQADRERKALQGFTDTQVRVACNNRDALPVYAWYILQDARKIIKGILGKYNALEHVESCRFGKRASVGVKYRESYLHNKCKTLSSSNPHSVWFQEVLEIDPLLKQAVFEGRQPTFLNTKCLEVSTVPKAWDKLRTILKNTTVGAFYTAGLGELMVSRMELGGIDLSRKSNFHRKFIKESSITRKYVTTDLRAASDSFYRSLMNMLFPRDWYTAMSYGQVRNTKVGDRVIQMSSFMTMGVGFTFPAQSIAFYAIVKAVMARMNVSGTCSAFGDDLIYPRKVHGVVTRVLTDLGFIINTEKSYANEYFRESCGADYYAGLDVRPYQPEGEHVVLAPALAVPFLYKVLNGWIRRWSDLEIPRVFKYLLDLLSSFHSGPCYQVPMDFPDYSGYKTPFPIRRNAYFMEPTWNANASYFIPTCGEQFLLHEVPEQLVYLWDCLRSKERPTKVTIWDKKEDSTVLIWRSARRCARSRIRMLKAYVPQKGVKRLPVKNFKTVSVWATTQVA